MIKEIKEYKNILQSLPQVLADSPYKMGHIVKQSGITAPTFYRKLKTKTFTADEVEKIVKIIKPEEAYKYELLESLEKSRNDLKDGRVVSHEDAMKEFKKIISK